jgi:phosphonoacetaldehyde hydrolase
MDFVFNRTYRGPLQAVLLDWAGTTMDYGCYAPAVVFIDIFKRNGVEITMEQAREPMGAHKREHIRQITQIDAVRKQWMETHGGTPPTDADVEKMFAEFVPAQLEVLARYADLIPGCSEAVADFRRRGLKIGSTTGYTGEMMEILVREAAARGYEPDSTVCATDVPAGRPEPWMCLKNAEILRVYPMEAAVKIGDTLPDIYEGLNAGMWTIGLAMTGNELGLNEAEIAALDPQIRERKRQRAYTRMAQAGAHYVVDGIADCPPLLDDINARLARGERP